MTGPALVIMAREPVPGQVKTRLLPFLTPEQSATLYLAFLKDILKTAASVRSCKTFLAFTPPQAEDFFRNLAPPGAGLLPQGDGDLGRKMFHVSQTLNSQGYSPVIIVGSDHPTLQSHHIEQAIDRLSKFDVCLGPCPDGGYYLVGMREPSREIFRDIPWSTPNVLETTVSRATQAGLSLGLLDSCSDVDSPCDLRWLQSEIERLKRTPGFKVPLHTEAWLRTAKIQ